MTFQPCPSCGTTRKPQRNYIVGGQDKWYRCWECKHHGPARRTWKEATAAWNAASREIRGDE